MKAWRPNWVSRPVAARMTKRSVSASRRSIPRTTMNMKTAISRAQTIIPNSSPITAKTKSAWASGSTFLMRPSPGPVPISPPLPKASSATFTW